MNNNIELMMPIKAAPYEHQKRAFAFAMKIFGILQEEGDADAQCDSDLRFMREGIPKTSDRNT